MKTETLEKANQISKRIKELEENTAYIKDFMEKWKQHFETGETALRYASWQMGYFSNQNIKILVQLQLSSNQAEHEKLTTELEGL